MTAALAVAGMVGAALTGYAGGPHPIATDRVAATVNGKPILMSDVQQEAMVMAGAPALQRLIQFQLIDNAAHEKGITVTAADLDKGLAEERAKLAPRITLEDQLKQHLMTLAQFEVIMRHNIELRKLLIGQVKIFPLYHLRAIMVFAATPGAARTGPTHTDAQAGALTAQAETDLTSGKTWDDMVSQYSEDAATKAKSGDLGIINAASGYDQGFINAAAGLKNGQISAPFKILEGYAIVQRISATGDHPASEDTAYADAESAYEEYMVGHLTSEYVDSLQRTAKIVNGLSQ
jgi:parvulin-like peptidyl-prolyl isomerase